VFFEEDDLGGEECAEGVGDEDGDVADDGADALDADPSATHFTLALHRLRHRRHRVTGVPARATNGVVAARDCRVRIVVAAVGRGAGGK
jgi:hypothetical protein